MNRTSALKRLGGAFALAFVPNAASAQVEPVPVKLRALQVPFDHERPHEGSFALEYALLRSFDARLPTVAVISDGQQFFITAKAFRPTTQPLFDERFNVVGLFGRGASAAVQQRIQAGGSTDWPNAYRYLQASQWLGDIDAMRRDLLGTGGKLLLYGRSGGAMMVHQYLTQHGNHVARAFTQASIDNHLEVALGLESDHFWDELSPQDRESLGTVLRRAPRERSTIIAVFQRQNFFVERAHLEEARHTLIASLAAGNSDAIERLANEYQVSAIRRLESSPLGPAIAVRLFELEAPFVGRYDFAKDPRVFPDHESAFVGAAPLFEAARTGRIPVPAWDHRALHAVSADVAMLAGRWDHTCDYRSQIALAAHYPASRLVIVDDDHTFHRVTASGKVREITIGALSAPESAPYTAAMAVLDSLQWRG